MARWIGFIPLILHIMSRPTNFAQFSRCVGKALAQAHTASGMSLDSLARRARLHRFTVAKVFHGHPPSLRSLHAISKALNCQICITPLQGEQVCSEIQVCQVVS